MAGKVDVKIIRMEEKHVPDVFKLDQKSFTLPWSERSYIFEVRENPISIPLVAIVQSGESSGQIAGFIVIWSIEDEAHIGTIAVDQDFQRLGIAEMLIETGLEQAKARGAYKVFLEVRESNLPARNLYHKLGFYDFDLRKKYYSDNQEDAIIMLLDHIA